MPLQSQWLSGGRISQLYVPTCHSHKSSVKQHCKCILAIYRLVKCICRGLEALPSIAQATQIILCQYNRMKTSPLQILSKQPQVPLELGVLPYSCAACWPVKFGANGIFAMTTSGVQSLHDAASGS